MKEIKNVQVIGVGVIGEAVIEDMIARENELVEKKQGLFEDKVVIWGVDKDEKKQQKNPEVTAENVPCEYVPYEVFGEIKEADAHIVSVYTTDQIFEVLNKIPLANDPMIIMESTVNPERYKELEAWQKEHNANVVVFPHRFNPNDPPNRVFNLWRVAGIMRTEDHVSVQRFIKRYTHMVIYTKPEVACLSKVLENSYRYVEIAIAEELKMQCDKLGIDYTELRFCSNTKWNIDIKEARDGIGGPCLCKDSDFLLDQMPNFKFVALAKEIDKEYQESLKK